MQNFAETHLKPETLGRYGLPDILFPVPKAKLQVALSGDGELRWRRCCTVCNSVAGMARGNGSR